MEKSWGQQEFESFVWHLSRSGLLAQDEIDCLPEAFGKPTESHAWYPPALTDLTSHLVASGLLTCWQCKKLREGRWRGFFLDDFVLLDHAGSDDSYGYYLGRHTSTGVLVVMRITPQARAVDPNVVEYEIVWQEGGE